MIFKMKRLFIGLPLPAEVKEVLTENRAALLPLLRRGRPTQPVQMHITVAFLGDTPSEEVPPICEALQALRAHRPFRAETTNWGVFSRRKALLWIGVDPENTLATLASDVRKSLGLRPERFTPHITMIRDVSPVPSVFPPLSRVSWTVDSVCLFESQFTREGMRYTLLCRIPLQGDSQ